jgi:hypothetical protein
VLGGENRVLMGVTSEDCLQCLGVILVTNLIPPYLVSDADVKWFQPTR